MSIPAGPVSSWTQSQIANLTAANLPQLTPSQVNQLSAAQVGYFNVAIFTQNPGLAAQFIPQLSSSTAAAVNWFNLGYNNLAYLTASQAEAIFVANGPGVVTGSWFNAQTYFNTSILAQGLAALSLGQLNSVTGTQWTTLFQQHPSLASQFIPLLSPSTAAAVNWVNLGYNNLAYLTASQAGAILVANGPGVVTGSWFNAQTYFNTSILAQGLAALSLSQLNSVTAAQWTKLFQQQPSLASQFIPLLTPGTAAAVNWVNLGYNNLAYLTAPQAEAILVTNGPGVVTGSWYDAQTYFNASILAQGLAALSASQLKSVTSTQWTTLFQQQPNLAEAIVPVLSQNSAVAAKFPPLFWQSLSPAEVGAYDALTPAQLNALTPSELFTASQVILGAEEQAIPAGTPQGSYKTLVEGQDESFTSELTVSNDHSLISQELQTLGTSASTSFNAIWNSDAAFQAFATYTDGAQLANAPYIANTQVSIDGGAYIDWYDAQYKANPNIQEDAGLTTLYDNILSRGSLGSDSSQIIPIHTDAQDILNYLTYQENAIVTAPPATGTDVPGYVQAVDDALHKEEGTFTSLSEALNGLNGTLNAVQQLSLDTTTGATFSPDVLQWELDGASATDGVGGLTYENRTNQTFEQALDAAESDLFTSGDTFLKNCNTGINQIVANKKAADEKALISEILNIVGSIFP